MATTEEWNRQWKAFSEMQIPDGGFGYAPGLKAGVEPTVHAILAGLAGNVNPREFDASLKWLAEKRNPDGSVPCSMEFPDQGLWLSAPYALAMFKAGDTRSALAAVEFLLSFTSVTVDNTGKNDLDGSLVGWPWGKGAFSWVEPTVWSLLALEAAGKGDHPRAVEGRRVLVDRQMRSGGWNYGNKHVYGQDLIPFADTTALALLALYGRVPDESIEVSITFLEAEAVVQNSPYALALSGLALRRCRRGTVDAVLKRLEEKMSLLQGERMNMVHLGLCLQALGKRGILWE